MRLGRWKTIEVPKPADAPQDGRSRSTAGPARDESADPPAPTREATAQEAADRVEEESVEEERTAAVEDAIVSINDSIRKLTAQLERIDRLVETNLASSQPADG